MVVRADKIVVGKRIAITAISVLVLGMLFWFLMAAAYAIPASQLTTHASQSRAILKQEGILWMQNAALTGGAHYDNYTTYHMLNISVQVADNPLVDAVSSGMYQGSDPDDGLAHAIAGESNESYQRYWHGYVSFLRPLLVFFDIKQIRLICQTICSSRCVFGIANAHRGCSWRASCGKFLRFGCCSSHGNASVLFGLRNFAYLFARDHFAFSSII